MEVLISGATGLVGQHLLGRLLARGDRIRTLVLPEALERLRYRDQVEVLLGSLADSEVLERAVEGVEVVYHLAELGPVRGRQPQDVVETNVRGTEKMLRACGEGGTVRRFVFNSSVQVYSPHPSPHMWPVREDAGRRAHGSEHMKIYGQSKIEAEDLIMRLHRQYGFEHVILRPATVYGPGQNSVEQLILSLISHPGRAFSYDAQWGGMQWVYAGDLAEAFVLAGTRPEAANHFFTIAGGELMNAHTVAATIWQIIYHARHAEGHRMRSHKSEHDLIRYDLTKGKKLLGYVPQVTLTEGLGKVLASMDLHRLGAAAHISMRSSRNFAQTPQ